MIHLVAHCRKEILVTLLQKIVIEAQQPPPSSPTLERHSIIENAILVAYMDRGACIW
jgi:hypothetical protein